MIKNQGIKNGNYKHGLREHPLYDILHSIKQRCYNPKNKNYKDYGFRNIVLCNEWNNDFLKFYKWSLENGWKPGLQIDRINNDGNYEPNNCRFITSGENNSNRRDRSRYGTNVTLKKSGKFQVQIRIDNKTRYVGMYNTPEEAQQAYQLKAMEIEKARS